MTAGNTFFRRLQQLTPLLRNRLPGQIIIQYTDMCNARCPQCGMRATESFKRSTLDLDTAKKIIDRAASNGVTALSLTGGEPLLFLDQVAELIRYARNAGITYTRTGTNGFLFMNHDRPDYEKRVSKIAETLARSGLYTFWISIDSCIPAIHEQMRGLPGVIAGIEKALPILHEHGIYPSANLGINRNIGLDAGGNGSPSIAHPLEFYESFRECIQPVLFLRDRYGLYDSKCLLSHEQSMPMKITDSARLMPRLRTRAWCSLTMMRSLCSLRHCSIPFLSTGRRSGYFPREVRSTHSSGNTRSERNIAIHAGAARISSLSTPKRVLPIHADTGEMRGSVNIGRSTLKT